MFKYHFQIIINDGEGGSYISVKAEDMDEAVMEAEAKAKRLCKKYQWTFRSVEFLYVD